VLFTNDFGEDLLTLQLTSGESISTRVHANGAF